MLNTQNTSKQHRFSGLILENGSMENKEVLNFDPNLTLCGRTVNQEVRLTFAQWDYQLTETVTVGGNCTGIGVIEFAVERFF